MAVIDLEVALRFYTELLDFKEAWRYDENGETIVAQVNRGDCETILAIDSERAGKSRLFIALEQDEMETLQEQIVAKSLSTRDGWWGYPVIEIRDPDGNELLFPVEESGT